LNRQRPPALAKNFIGKRFRRVTVAAEREGAVGSGIGEGNRNGSADSS